MPANLPVTALVNATFFTGDSLVTDRSLLFDRTGILGWSDSKTTPSGASVIDAGGSLVAPGLIDLQVNGAGIYNCSTFTSADDVRGLGVLLARTGTTRWAPTILSRPVATSRAIAGLIAPVAEEAGVIGLHIEGPWLNPDKAGAHTIARLGSPTSADVDEVRRIADLMPTIVTIAPELFSNALLDSLTQHPAVRAMLAHSAADFDATSRFFDRGGAGITHVFNTMHGIGSRAPGPIPAMLSRPGKRASVIADGVHVHPATIATLKRAADPDALFLVSDLIWDEFHLQSDRDQILAGSKLTMLEMVRFCVNAVGLSPEESLRMASLYPARFLGVESRYGRIAPGYVADLIGANNEFALEFSIRNGKLVPGGEKFGAA